MNTENQQIPPNEVPQQCSQGQLRGGTLIYITQVTINEIVDSIHSIPNRVQGHGNRAWTQAVKSAFIDLGKHHKWLVCASSSVEGVEPEWLYDLCWYSRSDNDEFSVGLVLESEWACDYFDLRFDFEKLLCAKSPFKVFIFEAYEDVIQRNLSLFESAIRKCKHSSKAEVYVLGAYNPAAKGFEIRIVEGV